MSGYYIRRLEYIIRSRRARSPALSISRLIMCRWASRSTRRARKSLNLSRVFIFFIPYDLFLSLRPIYYNAKPGFMPSILR